MSDPQDIPEDGALAAEYVLRLLDGDAERAFEARLKAEHELRAQVQFWEAEFAALAADVPDVAPPPAVKSRLLAKLHGERAAPWRGSVWGWLAWPALAAVAVVAFLALSPMLRGPAFDPAFHATLISEDGAVHIEAGYAPDGNLFKVIPEQGAPMSGRDFELWVIGENADAPVSLGVIPAGGQITFEISPEIAAMIEGGTLAVSDEPEGGSPTGAPTGAILAAGQFFDV
ncbi:anti-sigma factor [Aquicoccus porphyridii]|uniref:anti-sigma factor n=1 Tax=Aquicoccus porphyridii TaxID=1852029 RepID=UPI00273D1A77|nr:anti-sigma factor [Aquicoccus porphyridii]